MKINIPILRSILLLAVSQLCVSALQFCEDKAIERSDFCIAINTFHNESTTVDDWYVSISARFFQEKNGWLAFGAGNYIMHRTLMFVMYPGIEHGSVVVGPRSTQFHNGPKWTSDLPQFEVKRTDFKNGYHSADFVCYGCNTWDGSSLKPDATSQPWIWATHPFQNPESNDADKRLERHEYFGSMFLNMASSRKGDASGAYFPAIPSKKSERVSISAGHKSNETGNRHSDSTYVLHGILLALAFGLLYPTGVVAALGEHRWKSVKSHWIVQSATAASALFGILIGAYNSIARGGLNSLLHWHQAIGILVGMALLAQGLIGWRHHVMYVRTQAPTSIKIYHVWLGRALYGLGALNAILGLIGHGRRWLAVSWVTLIVAQMLGYFFVLTRKEMDSSHGHVGLVQNYTYEHVAAEDEDSDFGSTAEKQV